MFDLQGFTPSEVMDLRILQGRYRMEHPESAHLETGTETRTETETDYPVLAERCIECGTTELPTGYAMCEQCAWSDIAEQFGVAWDDTTDTQDR